MTWTLITVAYNSAARLREYWSTIRLSDSVEWIVIDNGSIDDSVEYAKSLGAVVIQADRNLGFSKANNLGLAHAAGKHVLFANPDLSVVVDDLPELERILGKFGGITSPQLRSPDGAFQHNGRGWPFLHWKVRNRLSSRGAGSDYLRRADHHEYEPVAWLTGASIAGLRDDFRRIGGWDEDFFLYNEDVAIGLAARRAGMGVGVATRVAWTHGWEREPAKWRLKPVLRELSSTATFYRKEPLFLAPPSRRRHPEISRSLRTRYGIGLDLTAPETGHNHATRT